MGLAFYLADDRRAINLETPYANLSGGLYEYMYRHSDELSPEAAFFYRLDPYGEERFDCDQARYISELCGLLLRTLAASYPKKTDDISKTDGNAENIATTETAKAAKTSETSEPSAADCRDAHEESCANSENSWGGAYDEDEEEDDEGKEEGGEDGEDGELSSLPPFLLRLQKLCDTACEIRSHIIMLGD